MNYLSFKILIISILLPPVLYIGSILSLEHYLNDRFTTQIESVYIGDTRPLFAGSVRLRDAVTQNIRQYLSTSRWVAWGVKTGITVTTRQGTLIYPAFNTDMENNFDPLDAIKIASDNFTLMNEGLTVATDVKLEHNTLLANSLLIFYILVTVGAFYVYYRAGVKRSRRETVEKETAIEQLRNRDKTLTRQLDQLKQEKTKLSASIDGVSKKLNQERQKASRDEDDYIEEIISLEKKLKENLSRQKVRQGEIDALKDEIGDQEKTRQKLSKQRAKSADAVSRRFKALYKKLRFHDRAIDGFVELADDTMKIKCEEIIHQLDKDPKKVPIKRKVFGKKNRETVFEILLAYNGRLYYRPLKDHTLEILTIGTKNTQTKDLAFLEKL